MKRQTYLQKTKWWFLHLLKGWTDIPNWWAGYGYAWKDAAYSLLEFIVLVLSPLLSITAPIWALIQHIKERK